MSLPPGHGSFLGPLERLLAVSFGCGDTFTLRLKEAHRALRRMLWQGRGQGGKVYQRLPSYPLALPDP